MPGASGVGTENLKRQAEENARLGLASEAGAERTKASGETLDRMRGKNKGLADRIAQDKASVMVSLLSSYSFQAFVQAAVTKEPQQLTWKVCQTD